MDLPIRLVDGAISHRGSWLLLLTLKKILGCWRLEESCVQWLSAGPDISELISSHDSPRLCRSRLCLVRAESQPAIFIMG
jgi:hypothetical protein